MSRADIERIAKELGFVLGEKIERYICPMVPVLVQPGAEAIVDVVIRVDMLADRFMFFAESQEHFVVVSGMTLHPADDGSHEIDPIVLWRDPPTRIVFRNVSNGPQTLSGAWSGCATSSVQTVEGS